MQGYYFARPMPIEAFEKLLDKGNADTSRDGRFVTDLSGATDFLSASTQATLLFNSFVGGASIIEYDGDNVEVLRFNDKYFEAVGVSREKYDGRQLLKQFDEHNREVFLSAIRSAVETGDEVSCKLCTKLARNGGEVWTQTRMRLLATSDNRYILYSEVENITDEVESKRVAVRQAEEIERQRASLKTLYDTIPCGILEFELSADQASARLKSFNDAAWRMCGYESRTQFVESLHGNSKLKDVHPDDLQSVMACVDAMRRGEDGVRTDVDHRILRLDGGIRWVRSIFQLRREGCATMVQVVFTDITEHKQASFRRLSGALFGLYDEVFEIDMERDTCFMRSAKKPDDPRIGRLFAFSKLLKTMCDKYACQDEGQRIRAFYDAACQRRNNRPNTLEFRYINMEGEQRWASATVVYLDGSAFLSCNRDISIQKNARRLARENAVLQTLFNKRKDKEERNRPFIHRAGLPMLNNCPEGDATHIQCWDQLPKKPIDEAKQNETELYIRALYHLYDEVFLLDYSNNAFQALYLRYGGAQDAQSSLNLQEAVERWAARFVAQKDRASFLGFVRLQSVREAFQKSEGATLCYEVMAPDGSQRFISSQLLWVDEDRYLCLNRDVTERRKTEQRRREELLLSQAEEQDRYRIVVEQTDTAVVDMNYKTGEFSCSEAYGKYEVSRRSQEDIMRNACDRSLVHKDDQDKLKAFFALAASRTPYSETVLRLKMTDGSFRWTRMAGTYIRNGDGKLVRAVGTFTDVDGEMRSKLALEDLSERMRRIIANIPTGVAIFEAGEKFLPVYVSDKTCEMFGFSREEYELRIANNEPLDFLPDASALPEGGMDRLLSGQMLVLQRLRVKRKDGGKLWLRIFMSLGEGRGAAPLCYAVLADISEEVALEQRFMWQTEKYKILSESADMITFDYTPQDDEMHISVPTQGGGFAEEVRQHYLETFDQRAQIPEKEKKGFVETLRRAIQTATRGTYDFVGDYMHTGARWYRAKYVSLADEEGRVYRVVGRLDDINDMMREQDQLRADAETDVVTGVYNKRYAVAAIGRALREKEPERFDAILFLDVDNFKTLNDTYGHLEADDVLRQVGEALRGLFRREDVIARFGGDEFIIYMYGAGNMETVTRKAAEVIRLVKGVTVGKRKPVTCSIGLTDVVGEGVSYEEAIKRADMALYEAKRNGKNQYAVVERQHGNGAD